MQTAVIDLARVRAARQLEPVTALARRLVVAYRAAGAEAPASLTDAAKSPMNRAHRPLARKLAREVVAARAAGVSSSAIRAALVAFAAELAPDTHTTGPVRQVRGRAA